ncbi:pyridoxamine 5'-phosphate oxidase-related FMN- binding [Catenulispora acidiphila DSM 44928]|uniref:Pyridoxamine 5'-phosphate oxidase-related FMN-binding n=1 Tax=Catenulispora acidiphila (strain DSM 44928 / JCM 14897 / NBRC 102108 / NRRL B-24433 / ID139908) TaxID=479433 RepID=C7PWP1_CATAD|nr:TIGR03618 family F420-dependent PPOX class oxidoreductase [Catenulispora acidiphila]ACU75321.1 pyridoxamine 5'-phosphate oxidase-related FMN- binding [Catenulispora acidiphila DSM 44928]
MYIRLSPNARAFLARPATATFTTLRPDGTPHVTPVRFTADMNVGRARVTTRAAARKARNVAVNARVVLCQVDGARWMSLEGRARLTDDPSDLAEAVRRYAMRYGMAPPAPPDLVLIEITVDRVLGLNL